MALAGRLFVYPISSERATQIKERRRIVNRGYLYVTGASCLLFAVESLYRNIGGSPEISSYLFDAAKYTLLGASMGFLLNNAQGVVSHSDNSLESKVSSD